MTLRVAIIILIISVWVLPTSAQSDTMPHTFALVVGISDYKDQAIKDLKFADDDAIMFANFLKTSLVKKSDTGNVVLLVNNKAAAMPVWAEIYKIEKNAKKGDTVYFYFSGHGLATNPHDIFILCHDGIKGYPDVGGSVNIGTLKAKIKNLVYHGVKVFLITDACRSNEMADPAYSLLFTEALSENNGEIQFTSCSSNEKSLEDRRWGKGHGVFTWYMLKGWMGMADKNNNKRVTFEELSNYISERVGQDTYDSIQDKSMQTPYSCCSKFNATLMGLVDPEMKKRLQENEESGDNNLYAVLMPRYYTRDVDSYTGSDSVALAYYNLFNSSIDKEDFIYPETECAVYYYEKLKERDSTSVLASDAKLDLVAGMANKAQSYIHDYLQGSDSITSSEFWYASQLMYKSLTFMDTSNEMYTSLSARALFLEANSMMHTQDEMVTAFRLLDSSLKLEPNKAYVYYNKARICERFKTVGRNFGYAEEYYNKAMELAPKWVFPVMDLGGMYVDAGQYDKGTSYFRKAIDMSPGPYIYTLLGYTYQRLMDTGNSESDTALMYYRKALDIDTGYIEAMLGIASVYKDRVEVDSAVKYYVRAMQLDTSYYNTYMHLGALFYDAGQYERAEEYYRRALYHYPGYIQAHWMLGVIYQYKLVDKSKAIDEYWACLQTDYYYTKAYKAIGNILKEFKSYNQAIQYLKYPVGYDQSYDPNVVASAYLDRASDLGLRADLDSAKMWLDSSELHFPGGYFTQTLYGFYYTLLKDTSSAIVSYRSSLKIDSTYYYNWMKIGDFLSARHQYDSAIFYYSEGIRMVPDNVDLYRSLWRTYFYGTKDYKAAIWVNDMALARNLDNYDQYYRKSLALWGYGEYSKALTAIDSALLTYPLYGWYHYTRAMSLASLGRKKEALKVVKLALKFSYKYNQTTPFTKDDFYNGYFTSLEKSGKLKRMIRTYHLKRKLRKLFRRNKN